MIICKSCNGQKIEIADGKNTKLLKCSFISDYIRFFEALLLTLLSLNTAKKVQKSSKDHMTINQVPLFKIQCSTKSRGAE